MSISIGVRRVFDTQKHLVSRHLRWDIAWATWLIGTIGSFAVLEMLAYHRRSFPTLSVTLRRWMGVNPRKPHHHVASIGFGAFWIWLTIHVGRAPRDRTLASALQNDFKTERRVFLPRI
jgi:hypothetical protein